MDTTSSRPGPASHAVPASPGQLAWLREQLGDWRAEGLVDDRAAAAILGRYSESRRLTLGRLLLAVGAAFLGVGLIWLVAANLDQLSPMVRFVAVVALWLACLVGAEVLDARAARFLVVEAVRTLAAFGAGAVVFQAAQSLQVAAYEPVLLGVWGLGALVHAYAVRALGPLLVGVGAATGWSLWQGLSPEPTFTGAVLVVTASGVLALALAGVHARWWPEFAPAWRHVGAALLLVGLFVAGVPVDEGWDLEARWWPVTLGAAAVLLALLVAVRGPAVARVEVLVGVAVVAVALVLAGWSAGADPERVGLADWGHAALGVLAYLALAVGTAALGTWRDTWVLTAMAAVGLVVFTTFQAFAVFAPIVQGAWLFLLLGAVLVATGLGFDRTRRHLAQTLEEDRS